MPEWLASGLFTAVGGVLGYFGKSWIEARRERKAAGTDTLRQLRQLGAFLDESYKGFQSQLYLANQLLQLVRKNHAGVMAGAVGYDETFRAAFDEFTPDEAELHAIVRAMTMYPMLRVNEDLKNWAGTNVNLVHELPQTQSRAQLQTEIANLASHLNEWFAKYHALISDKKRSVIFLADEKKQGTRFPQELTPALQRVIAEMAAS